jgi:hypothetical protein
MPIGLALRARLINDGFCAEVDQVVKVWNGVGTKRARIADLSDFPVSFLQIFLCFQ